jgi:enterochelin esterase-like enzyme
MRRFKPRTALLVLLATLAAAAAVAAALAAASGSGTKALRGTLSYATYVSKALEGTVHYSVYLPAGYATGTGRYRVIYFLHGLPASPQAYKDITQVASAIEKTGDQAIVVGVQGARAGDEDPEYIDWGPGREWETAIAKELVAVVDQRYRTIANRSGRMLAGISAGGYGATLIALHNPGVFGAVESWSGYFYATTPDGTAALDLGSAEANERANASKLIPKLRTLLGVSTAKTYFAFYVGSDDALFRATNEQFYEQLKAAGIYRVTFSVYPGGHNWTLWGRHASAWLHNGLTALVGMSTKAT